MDSSQEWTSLREFARRCGRRHRAAQKAIEDGRIPASAVKRDERGRIVAVEYRAAHTAWMERTDPTRITRPLRVQAPARRPASAPDVAVEIIGKVLSVAFANALVTTCGMAVARCNVSPETALEIYQDYLMFVAFAAADAMNLDREHDDRPELLFSDDLKAALDTNMRGALLERIDSMARDMRLELQHAALAGAD